MTKFTYVANGEQQSIVALIDGELYTATQDHPNWNKINFACFSDEDLTADLFSLEASVEEFFRLSDRVSVANGRVYFDGDVVNNLLTTHILRSMEEGSDWLALVMFYEKLAQNPSEHSREQLYAWLESNGEFTISKQGDIVGYKGVYLTDEGYQSVSSGTATVSGVTHRGQIPQKDGDVVEMPRSSVAFDPGVGCSTGLHVGTWGYARSFVGDAGAVLKVYVNPRDVVSVPSDCAAQKMRVCRYTVDSVIEGPIERAVEWEEDEDDLDDEGFYEYEESDLQEIAGYFPVTTYLYPVDSAFIGGLFYHLDTQRLWVLIGNYYYCYEYVPSTVAYSFMEGDSKGRFYKDNILGVYNRRFSDEGSTQEISFNTKTQV